MFLVLQNRAAVDFRPDLLFFFFCSRLIVWIAGESSLRICWCRFVRCMCDLSSVIAKRAHVDERDSMGMG